MDEFSNLTIADKESLIHEKDLEAILELKICENEPAVENHKLQLSQRLRDKIMPHVPSSPSPLRQSMLESDYSDEMDVDSVGEIDAMKPMQEDNNYDKDDEIETDPVDNDLLDDTESTIDENSNSTGPSSKAVIKALLSPTRLGVAAATKLDQLPGKSDHNEEIYDSGEQQQPEFSENRSFVKYSENSEGLNFGQEDLSELRYRSNQQPIQISINNHHYYYPQPELYARNDISTFEKPNSLQLPNPWSSYSHPASRTSYLLTSYLQIFLNALTALLLFSLALIFMRSLKADLRSAWEVAKLDLDHESIQCQRNYDLNHCDRSTRVEAMEEQCTSWHKCMSRNNDIFFRARTTISAKLIGDVVNSFVEPLGWKTLCVILSGLAIWCFSSNFILGFARAKSYYGSSQQEKPVEKRRDDRMPTDSDKKLLR
ncbi:LAFA_0E12816g1_1 [Lachancea sp. 'fantastica']|nr:LAFA_0E12816g1_1 [Lachancea sp. 'fantastica']